MIELKNVSKTFDSGTGEVDALKNVTLTINDGDIYGIIGMSGAGKSTLVRCINLLEKPSSGEIIVNGERLDTMSPAQLRAARRNITMIFQHFNLLMQRTCLKNICFPMELAGVKKAEAEKRARELLELVGLPDKANAYPAQLSGGQQQRIAIARALATDPKVLLCDEATSALDPKTTRQILELIKDINRKLGITVVIITHQMSVVEEICDSVAILPQDMSKERFDWLKTIAGQIIATPGCESNVKEIFDKTWELKQDPSMMIFNQFAEMGNPLWHYNVTGYALSDLFENVKKPGQRLAGACFTSGSAGTMSAGDLLKERYPGMKLAVGEALQCPTILDNGFGGHRIEGIGDKHIPWVHNVKNTDMVIDIDDEDSQRLLRLFNCKEGQEYLKTLGLSDEQIEKFTWMGISGIANVLCCIKFAKYYELTEDDVVVTVLTDSAVMYKSRVEELNEMYGAYSAQAAELDHNLHMLNLKTDNMMELTYPERKRVHNLKYYTWVEQQGMTVEDLNAQWYDVKNTWDAVHAQAKELDELINAFNDEVGLLKAL